MQYGISDKGKHGAISKLSQTDYCLGWLAWFKAHGREIVCSVASWFNQEFMLKYLRDAFDAGWDARGRADLAIIAKSIDDRKDRDDLDNMQPGGDHAETHI